jgi:hypothetical protein
MSNCWLNEKRICNSNCKAYHALLNECTIIYLLSEISVGLVKINNTLINLVETIKREE